MSDPIASLAPDVGGSGVPLLPPPSGEEGEEDSLPFLDTAPDDAAYHARDLDTQAKALIRAYLGNRFDFGATRTGGERPLHSPFGFGSTPSPEDGLNLPTDFASALSGPALQSKPLKSFPPGCYNAFNFVSSDQDKFFRAKELSADTRAFAASISADKPNPLTRADYKVKDTQWRQVEQASSLGQRLAIYSIAISDIISRAAELQVLEEDLRVAHDVIYMINVLSLSTASLVHHHAINRRRELVTDALSLNRESV